MKPLNINTLFLCLLTAMISITSHANDNVASAEPNILINQPDVTQRALLDHYQANISITNNSQFTLLFTGCNPADGKKSRCTVSEPGVADPQTTLYVGTAKSSKHGPSGDFTFIAEHLGAIPFKLNYQFNKDTRQTHLQINATGSEPSPLLFSIDTDSCTSNPDAQGIMRCCSFDRSRHTLHKNYEYQCTLPITAELASP
ncbi:hypothetical protein [Kistimonas asteriae]|uniref:hypothetical protein n=1 Tax=Kistimonas asteriae TaxID=517724 RepID=UPI001BA4AB1A|nr:hypothetical protein [Kistimonas asteriae]